MWWCKLVALVPPVKHSLKPCIHTFSVLSVNDNQAEGAACITRLHIIVEYLYQLCRVKRDSGILSRHRINKASGMQISLRNRNRTYKQMQSVLLFSWKIKDRFCSCYMFITSVSTVSCFFFFNILWFVCM